MFCPLCGSAIVFDRELNDEIFRFGVSGKLYQSNLLMYDDRTETLWSQSLWEAVVGKHTGVSLKRIKSDIMTYTTFAKLFPEGSVMSDDTWYRRNYARAPYGDYDTNDVLIFPVSHEDTRLPKKEILYVVNDGDESIAFVRKDLAEVGKASLRVWNRTYTAIFANDMIEVINAWKILPWYHEMRFSRATHNPKSKSIWMIWE